MMELYVDGVGGAFMVGVFWTVVAIAIIGIVYCMVGMTIDMIRAHKQKIARERAALEQEAEKYAAKLKEETTINIGNNKYENMPAWLVRLFKEAVDLQTKIDKLAAYLNPMVEKVHDSDNHETPQCGWSQYNMLCDQMSYMQHYYDILRDRISDGMNKYMYEQFKNINK